MTWPQLYVLSAMILSTVIAVASEARRPSRPSSKPTVYLAAYITFLLGFKVTMALVLHAGGFW